MASKPLEILKKGLNKFTETVKTRKNELSAKLARAETISSSDEQWLDNEANTVNDQKVLDTLQSASDYERGLECSEAVSTISRYIDGLNNPITRKFEALLVSFNRQLRLEETRSLKETILTDYFQRL